MILPEGKKIGKFSGPFEEVQPFINPLYGAVCIRNKSMDGFILVEKGRYLAVYFRDDGSEFTGDAALDRLRTNNTLEFELRGYSADEMNAALSTWVENYVKPTEAKSSPSVNRGLKPEALEVIQRQPGVIAVAAIDEGFTVLSTGSADFEQVGAIAEDLLRAGVSISSDLGIQPLEQMLLETPKAKLIIAPVGDLNLCVLSEAKANLGLIRIAIKKLQSEV
ncbi:MAG: roadblock/LC7 domain-containing protein [Methanomicrobiales archaeon]|nr:roadblock/LC7 domain-containing protein [Methanomicrobiales archaeon]